MTSATPDLKRAAIGSAHGDRRVDALCQDLEKMGVSNEEEITTQRGIVAFSL
jgi:hypothetical protein